MMMMTLLLVVVGVNAQKIDQRLTRLVENSDARRAQSMTTLNPEVVKQQIAVVFNADGTARSMTAVATLENGAECPTQQLEQMGIEVRYQLGDMVVMNVPADKLLQLEDVEEFRYISADEVKMKVNDKAREATNVSNVNTADAAAGQQLPKAYTGEGVVIGVIDGGIDFNHAAFRNADGTTRIKRAVLYMEEGLNVVRKVYETEAEIKALTTNDSFTSHGTHTSAIAGGSDVGNGFQGMAPQAELVLCDMGNNATGANIAECIQEIFNYAGNKPAVINISLGDILGLHDGGEVEVKAVATLTENGTKPGRAVVISACNSAANFQSIVKKFNSTTEELKTVLGTSTPSDPPLFPSGMYDAKYCLYADDYKDFSVQLKVVNLKTGAITDANVKDIIGNPITIEKETRPTLAGGTAILYWLRLKGVGVFLDDADSRLAFVVKAGHDGQTIKMACDSDNNYEPCFDAPGNLASAGFTKGNGEFTLNTSICNDYVISVGSYITRNSWTNYKGDESSYNPSKVTGQKQVIGEISDFSSYGLDDNGKPYPTLIAPGQGLISGCNNYDAENLFLANEPGTIDPKRDLSDLISYVDKHGRKNWYLLEQGTSMSAPVTTGIIALWMQAKQTLTTNEIKDILKATCVNDDFTTNTAMIPSGNKVQAGFGKIDCLAGLKEILGTTGIETISMDGHREATPATMYSVDAPVYNMMGQRVDKNTRGMVIYKGRKYVNR